MKRVFYFLGLVAVLLNSSFTNSPVVVHVRDFGLEPNAKQNAVEAVIKAIEACKKYPSAVLQFEKGRYDFWPETTHVREYFESNTTNTNPKRRLAILLEGCRQLTIEGNGAEFIFHGAMQPITVDQSEKITVRNVTIDWEIPLTAQGQVISASSKFIDLKIDTTQFPYEVIQERLIFKGEDWQAESRWFMEYEAGTHRIAQGTGDEECLKGDWNKFRVEALQPGVVRMNGEFTRTPAVGNFMILRHSDRDHAAVFIKDSKEIRLENVNIHHCAGLGVLSQFSSDLNFTNVRFVPNLAKNRYLSGHDDGFQVSNCKGNVIIDRCEFGGLMDDPINVHGTNVKIIEKINDFKLKCRFMHDMSTGMEWGHSNDLIGFVENESMHTVSKGTLKAFEKLNRDEFIVEFATSVPKEIVTGDALENLTWAPSVVIQNSKFGSCRARGILVSTPASVLIKGNEFESSGSAILIAGDANGWYESGAVNDVTIRNNVFKDACMTSMYQFCEGIISIYPAIPALDVNKPYHRNITIEENEFHPFDYPVLYALSVDGLKFSKNRIVRSYLYKPFHYRKHCFTFEACRNVKVKNNSFQGEILSKDIRIEKMDKSDIKTDLQISSPSFTNK